MFVLISNTNTTELIKANLLYITGNFCGYQISAVKSRILDVGETSCCFL